MMQFNIVNNKEMLVFCTFSGQRFIYMCTEAHVGHASQCSGHLGATFAECCVAFVLEFFS